MGKQRHDPGYKKRQKRDTRTYVPVSDSEARRLASGLVHRGLASPRILDPYRGPGRPEPEDTE